MQLTKPKPDTKPTYLTAYRKGEKGSKSITVYNATPEEAIGVFERAVSRLSNRKRKSAASAG